MKAADSSVITGSLSLEKGLLKKKLNKLINKKSPYLLEHAYNPVEWYPWNEESIVKPTVEARTKQQNSDTV